MDEETLERYRQYLRGKYRKKRTAKNYLFYTEQGLEWIDKPVDDIGKSDLVEWREYLINTYMPNGNARRVSSMNHFLKWYGKEDLKIPVPKQEMSNKVILNDKELDDYLKASEEDPLWHMVALLQTDGLLRPGEFRNLKLQNIDFTDLKLYLDDTKTGNNYIIMSPRLADAIEGYLPHRNPTKDYKDYLITVPKGRYKGQRLGEQVQMITNITRSISAKAGIKKRVSPYIIKPSAITSDFNKQINPRIIQRKARHKNIETTLRYDHTDDKMVREHFERQAFGIDTGMLSDKEKTKLMLDRFLKGEIDIETYKRSLDLLHNKHQEFDDKAYM